MLNNNPPWTPFTWLERFKSSQLYQSHTHHEPETAIKLPKNKSSTAFSYSSVYFWAMELSILSVILILHILLILNGKADLIKYIIHSNQLSSQGSLIEINGRVYL